MCIALLPQRASSIRWRRGSLGGETGRGFFNYAREGAAAAGKPARDRKAPCAYSITPSLRDRAINPDGDLALLRLALAAVRHVLAHTDEGNAMQHIVFLRQVAADV